MSRYRAARAVVVGLVAVLLTPVVPAHAAGGVTFTADVVINGFGIGASTGEAWLCVNGVVNGRVVTNTNVCSSTTGHAGANAHATFAVYEDPALCPAVGSANGSVTGVINTSFVWSRVGTGAVILTSGGDFGNGKGCAKFVVTDPLGNPCGTTGYIHASAKGSVAAA
jgi:hypothetical protein